MALLALTGLAAPGPGAAAQTAGAAPLLLSSSGAAPAQLVREIDDPHSGARWLLLRNPDHPAGPGRLVLAGHAAKPDEESRAIPPGETEETAQRPVIRAGDRLIVEENTPVIDARLEAVALGPATSGSTFEARLKIGGKVARVVALAPGRAAFQTEARP
jgi:hypothetical protein